MTLPTGALRRGFPFPPGILNYDCRLKFTGRLIQFRWENPSAIGGHVALSRASGNVSEHLVYLQSLNPSAVILSDALSDYAGTYDLEAARKEDVALLAIPCYQIGVIDRDALLNLLYANITNPDSPNNVTIRLEGESALEFNYWLVVRKNGVWYFVQVLICALMAACASMALSKLIAFVRKDRRLRLSVAQMALLIEYVQNMIRLIFWAVDPIWLQRGGFSWFATNALVTVHHPLFICSTLLLALYWHQLLKFDRVKVSVGLDKMRIPFVVIAGILVILEGITIGMRIGGFDVGTLTTVSGALIAVVAFVTSVYFVVIGVQVLKQLKLALAGPSKSDMSASHKSLIRRVRGARSAATF